MVEWKKRWRHGLNRGQVGGMDIRMMTTHSSISPHRNSVARWSGGNVSVVEIFGEPSKHPSFKIEAEKLELT